MMVVAGTDEFDQEYALEQLRRSRHPLRKIIKQFYLKNILRDVRGATIDLGCGAGQLLGKLHEGSIGLEVNPFLVDVLRESGLNVQWYDAESDGFLLRDLPAGRYETLVMAHVLEHIADAAQSLRILLGSCHRLGVRRVILVLPGLRGFRCDPTHKTFVDQYYLEREGLLRYQDYAATKIRHFPLNLPDLGKAFAFHELKVIYDLAQ